MISVSTDDLSGGYCVQHVYLLLVDLEAGEYILINLGVLIFFNSKNELAVVN